MKLKTSCYEPEILIRAKQLYKEKHPQVIFIVNQLLNAAEQDLYKGPFSVTYKKGLAPSGDTHDYVSLRRYFWPNLDSKDGYPWAEKDGETNPLIHQYDRTLLGDLAQTVKNLSLSFFMTEQAQFGQRAAELIKIWFINKDTFMNPHLKYASFVPGQDVYDGNGIINSVLFIRIIESIGLLWDSPYLSKSEKEQLQKWFLDFREWLLNSPNGKLEQQADNNHGLWFDAQILSFSFFCDQQDFIKTYLSKFTVPRMAQQIKQNGQMPREIERTLGLHYMEYALNALIDIASYAANSGFNLWNYSADNGAGIKKVVEFCLPFFINPETWPFQQINTFQAGKCAAHLYRIARHTDQKELRHKAKLLSGLSNISPHTLLVNGMWDLYPL
jgi:hypothetical protein